MLVVVVLLSVFGVVMINSATRGDPALEGYVRRQILWLCIGLVGLVAAAVVPYRLFEAFAYPLYAAVLILLVLLLLEPASFGARRWIGVGPLHFQPSEIAKLVVIFTVAKLLAGRKRGESRRRDILFVAAVVALPAVLILLEPDLGTAASLGAPLILMLFWRRVNIAYLLLLVAPLISLVTAFSLITWAVFMIALVVILYAARVRVIDALTVFLTSSVAGIITPLAWSLLKDYHRRRILAFLNPDLDPRGAGWHLLQSKIAIGSGGLLGKGYLAGTQKKLAFLPERHTDFIFSVIGEEFGLIGVLVLMGLYFILIYLGLRNAAEARNPFASLVAVGIVSILTFQIFVNIGVVTGLMPVTGIPLPFVTYGGSSLMTALAMVGVLMNVGRRRFEY
ncbi:hypothetical protein AMJ39_05345 [candidate division TA06 bacterium DG_24]|uniref:Peptidoglycan glycosyltransferase RodA n=3 Tax=Bacteria division TA06 TaxID=1156500 RepID=A0A0S8JM74_UNCT6|nr:MAG: hypothetical protein AMJ39_05345 [candidate division TA06 bacterium DG_24]KPK68591.1 MAG: hypothetical protein AMJ82_07860 [candidate division TA06 bacterium SM23_40]KPL09771.1 MAG: hypothetical protein AMJ71_05580 [candidate division TA06 bacterium SM1_40]